MFDIINHHYIHLLIIIFHVNHHYIHLLSSLITVLILSRTGLVPQLSSVVSRGTELNTMLVITWSNNDHLTCVITVIVIVIMMVVTLDKMEPSWMNVS